MVCMAMLRPLPHSTQEETMKRTAYEDIEALADAVEDLKREVIIAVEPLLVWILNRLVSLHTKASRDYLPENDEMT